MKLNAKQSAEMFAERRRLASAEREKLRNELAAKHGLKRDQKFEHAFLIAWDQGHSAGLSEVEIYFDELVPLLKP